MARKSTSDVTVKFLSDYEVQDEAAGTADAEKYKSGQRKSMSLASALHFVNRGVAEMLPAKKKVG